MYAMAGERWQDLSGKAPFKLPRPAALPSDMVFSYLYDIFLALPLGVACQHEPKQTKQYKNGTYMQTELPYGNNSLVSFSEIDNWIFDLDNTLYPRHIDLFKQMEVKMSAYVSRLLDIPEEEATILRKGYYKQHGTTLRGLMIEHNIQPDEFLEYVHDIDHSGVKPDPQLAQAICALPGKRYIYTNGTNDHAMKVAKHLGITDLFDDIFDIVWAGLDPKPNRAPYEKLLAHTGINPKRTAMFEDLARNLKVPHDMGMKTVLVVPNRTREVFHDSWEAKGAESPHVGYVTEDIGGFLKDMLHAIGRQPQMEACATCPPQTALPNSE